MINYIAGTVMDIALVAKIGSTYAQNSVGTGQDEPYDHTGRYARTYLADDEYRHLLELVKTNIEDRIGTAVLTENNGII